MRSTHRLHWCVLYGPRNKEQFPYKALKVKQSLYRPIADPDGARRLRLPDFTTISTRWYS